MIQLHKALGKIQESVRNFKATLSQFIMDGKNTVAIVVFGLPPTPDKVWDLVF